MKKTFKYSSLLLVITMVTAIGAPSSALEARASFQSAHIAAPAVIHSEDNVNKQDTIPNSTDDSKSSSTIDADNNDNMQNFDSDDATTPPDDTNSDSLHVSDENADSSPDVSDGDTASSPDASDEGAEVSPYPDETSAPETHPTPVAVPADEEETGTSSSAKVRVIIPTTIDFFFDPYDLADLGSLYSPIYRIVNKSNVDVEMSLSLYYDYLGTDAFTSCAKAPDEDSEDKAAYMYLNPISMPEYVIDSDADSSNNSDEVSDNNSDSDTDSSSNLNDDDGLEPETDNGNTPDTAVETVSNNNSSDSGTAAEADSDDSDVSDSGTAAEADSDDSSDSGSDDDNHVTADDSNSEMNAAKEESDTDSNYYNEEMPVEFLLDENPLDPNADYVITDSKEGCRINIVLKAAEYDSDGNFLSLNKDSVFVFDFKGDTINSADASWNSGDLRLNMLYSWKAHTLKETGEPLPSETPNPTDSSDILMTPDPQASATPGTSPGTSPNPQETATPGTSPGTSPNPQETATPGTSPDNTARPQESAAPGGNPGPGSTSQPQELTPSDKPSQETTVPPDDTLPPDNSAKSSDSPSSAPSEEQAPNPMMASAQPEASSIEPPPDSTIAE